MTGPLDPTDRMIQEALTVLQSDIALCATDAAAQALALRLDAIRYRAEGLAALARSKAARVEIQPAGVASLDAVLESFHRAAWTRA